ncbi:MAG: iron chelate uptake ABC transporter family permease subunit [Chloroflexota bacterium]|nr:iron chelate uptake ABC transporter family permease subunit [Chloroflexota bacterium]
MELGELLRQLVFDYTLRTIVLGCALLGIANGALGAFALLRRQSLIGDSLSHAALPGVCIAFLLAGETKNPLILLIGAAISGWLGSVLAAVITQNTRIKDDAAQGIVLATFFGTGYVLLSLIQSSAGAGQAGLDKYLFGSAASLIERDVQTIAVLSIVALSVLGWFYKEFKLLAFDGEFLASLGFPRRRLELLLTSLTVIVVVVGLQIVGVILMVAMLIAPAAAARQWTNRLSAMIGISMFVGAAAGVIGAVVSALEANTPTGPAIVLALTAMVIFSFAFGAERGLVWNALRARRNRRTALAHGSDAPVYAAGD